MAPWEPVLAVPTSVQHDFTLVTPQNLPGVTMLGTQFFIPPREPLAFPVKGVGPDVPSGLYNTTMTNLYLVCSCGDCGSVIYYVIKIFSCSDDF